MVMALGIWVGRGVVGVFGESFIQVFVYVTGRVEWHFSVEICTLLRLVLGALGFCSSWEENLFLHYIFCHLARSCWLLHFIFGAGSPTQFLMVCDGFGMVFFWPPRQLYHLWTMTLAPSPVFVPLPECLCLAPWPVFPGHWVLHF